MKTTKEKKAEYMKEWQAKNKDKMREYDKKRRERFGELRKDYIIKWKIKNEDKVKEYTKKSVEKRKEKPEFKINQNMHAKIYKSIKSEKESTEWENYVSYNRSDLLLRLQSLFYGDMSFKNYGKYWVIDHIIPKCKFKFVSVNDIGFKKCWALENLQPLTKTDNLKKGIR
jgi:5-methylcytosine-specific restriction endonuclease McrA